MKLDIEIRIDFTAVGTVRRSVRVGKKYRARINGEWMIVHEPKGDSHVLVDRAPRDIDRRGYE